MEYASEEEFLKNYDSSIFEKISMTTDVLLISVSSKKQNNYRKKSEKMMSILLVKREDYPYKDQWCLPGGFLDVSETLDECARRILKKETNLSDIYLEQLYTFSSVDRDPRMRIVSTSYIALVDKNSFTDTLHSNVSWFDIIKINEDKNLVEILLSNGDEIISFILKRTLRDKTTDRYQFSVIENTKLAFDHAIVILSGIERLKNKISYTDIVFNMMGEYFTLGELQQVYEVILNKKLLDPAFRRIIAEKVEKTDKIKSGAGHRPSFLYRYKK